MDNNKIKNKIKDDPAFTLEVQNPEVEELMTQYSSDKKAETLNKLIDKCTKSRFLVPANVGENNKPIPLFIKNGEGEAFMPIYTSKAICRFLQSSIWWQIKSQSLMVSRSTRSLTI